MEKIQIPGLIDIEIKSGLLVELDNDGEPLPLINIEEETKIRIGIDYILLVHTILSLMDWDDDGKTSEDKMIQNLFQLPSTIEARCKQGYHPLGRDGRIWRDKLQEWKNKLLNR